MKVSPADPGWSILSSRGKGNKEKWHSTAPEVQDSKVYLTKVMPALRKSCSEPAVTWVMHRSTSNFLIVSLSQVLALVIAACDRKRKFIKHIPKCLQIIYLE